MLHLHIHPENPQARLITQAVERIRAGDVVVYPTDAAYAIGCQIGNKSAMERIAQIRGLGSKHQYAIMCCDLSDIATYAKVDNGDAIGRCVRHIAFAAKNRDDKCFCEFLDIIIKITQ